MTKRWVLKEKRATSEREATLATEYRLHARYAELQGLIESYRDKYYAAEDYDNERRFAAELCELEIEFESIKGRLRELVAR